MAIKAHTPSPSVAAQKEYLNPAIQASTIPSPPWESPQIEQVPYLPGPSAHLPNPGKKAFPLLRAAPSTATKQRTTTTIDLDEPSDMSNITYRQAIDYACVGSPPLSAPLPSRQYEYNYQIPAAPRTEPSPPTYLVYSSDTLPRPTMYPQSGNGSTFDPPKLQQEFPSPAATAQTRSTQKHTSGEDAGKLAAITPRKATRLKSWRAALKGLFVPQAVEESELECVEQQHWSEL